MSKYLFTSESVTEGHPDKICDRISDAVLDAIYEQDPQGRVACESMITTDHVFVMGEISTKADIDVEKIAREAICDIGYDSEEKTFDGNTCNVEIHLDKQSDDIALGVDGKRSSVPVSGLRYLESDLPVDRLKAAYADAEMR